MSAPCCHAFQGAPFTGRCSSKTQRWLDVQTARSRSVLLCLFTIALRCGMRMVRISANEILSAGPQVAGIALQRPATAKLKKLCLEELCKPSC